MLQHKRIGLIIWGAILSAIGFVTFIGAFGEAEYESGFAAVAVIGVLVLAGGIIMLAFGIVNAVKVTRFNNALINDGKSFVTSCVNCNRVISAQSRDFRPHGRFPEGFIYCPVCKRPISKNAFTEYSADGTVLKEGAPQAPARGQYNQYNYYGQPQQNPYQSQPQQSPYYGQPQQNPYQGQYLPPQAAQPYQNQPYQGQYQNPQNNWNQ